MGIQKGSATTLEQIHHTDLDPKLEGVLELQLVPVGLMLYQSVYQNHPSKSASSFSFWNVDILLLVLHTLTVVVLHGGLGRVVVVLEFVHLSLQKFIASAFSASLRSVYCSR